MKRFSIRTRNIPTHKWCINNVRAFYSEHALNEIVALMSRHLSPLHGMAMKFSQLELVSDDKQLCGNFGPISSQVAHLISRTFDEKSYITIEEALFQLENKFQLDPVIISKAKGILSCALLDAKAKFQDQSVAELICGNPICVDIPCYASAITIDIDGDSTDEIARLLNEQNFWGQKWFLKDGPNEGNDGFIRNLRRIERLRKAIGDKGRLIIEVHGKWTEDYLTRFINNTQDANIEWIEDPFPAIHWKEYCNLGKISTPICIGEKFTSLEQFRAISITNNNAIFQVDIVDCGGFETAYEVQNLSNSNTLTYHGRALIPSLHSLASSSSSKQYLVEFNPIFEPERQIAMRQKLLPKNGFLNFSSAEWRGLWQCKN